MESKQTLTDSRRKARCIAKIWAYWLRKQGRPLGGGERRQLEVDLTALLARYEEEWGVSLVGLRFDPPRICLEASPAAPARGRHSAAAASS